MTARLIDSEQALRTFIASLQDDLEHDALLAVDTEFFRETSYYPALGLVQLATRNHVGCIDPLAFDARESLASLLLDKRITKLFHSCSQDLEVLQQTLGALPCPIIDTQIAAAMLGEKDQISYANLVAQWLGIELDKSQTRTNWLRRPLSAKQLEYAAEDVLYLIPVYELLYDNLEHKGRLDWLQQDCERLCQNTERFEPDMQHCWLRVKGTQKLTAEQLAVVDALARWRERKAMALDRTRRQVVSDDFIVQAAIEMPDSEQTLRACGKTAAEIDSRDFADMLKAIQQARSSNPQGWPVHPRQRLDGDQKKLIREMMNIIEKKADTLGIAQSTLGSRKEVEKMVFGQRDVELLKGWRLRTIGQQLLECLPQA